MVKTNNLKEYLFMKSINLKYNRYYVGRIRLHSKGKILEAYRLNLAIRIHDTLIGKSYFVSGE